MKKGLRATLSSFVLGSVLFTSTALSASPIYGDVSGDGIVDSADYTYLRKFLLTSSTLPARDWETSGDLNLDGVINSADFTILRKFLLKIITELPVGNVTVTPTVTKAPIKTPTATPTTVAVDPSNPVLVKSFSISSAGSACRMRVGDLNGDGRLDFLMVQATSENPSQVNALTAYDHTGKQMWKIGTDNKQTGTDRDEPAQIYDIDNDGQNEVLCVMNKKFRVLEGSTGKLEKEYNLPASSAHDCMLICNLTGSSYPQDIILKDRYFNAYAVDKDFKLLWSFKGATGHYPWNYDFDGDGYDEVMMSYSMLDHNGKRLWEAKDPLDHADCIQIGNIDGNKSNGLEVVLGTQGTYTVQAYNWKGNQLWQTKELVEGQQVVLGDFRPEKPGLEAYGLDRVYRGSPGKDALFLLDSAGKLFYKEVADNSGYGTAIKIINNWDGTNKPYCFAFKRGGSDLPGLYDGYGKKIAKFTVEGNTMVGDFCGDSKEEVIIYTGSTVNVYASGDEDYSQPAPNPGHTKKQEKANYNYSRYGSGEAK